MLEVPRVCAIPAEQDVELNNSEKWEGGGARKGAWETWTVCCTAQTFLLTSILLNTRCDSRINKPFSFALTSQKPGKAQYYVVIRLVQFSMPLLILWVCYTIYIWACSCIHTLAPPLTICSSLSPISIQLWVYSSSCPIKIVPGLGACPNVWSVYQASHH